MKFIVYLAAACLLVGCSSSSTSSKTLRISTEQDASSLDPRQARDVPTATIMHMFFEGLTRVGPEGKIEPAAAESVVSSSDLKTYTFKLRDAEWSNGDPVTAKDFEESWKSMLDPHFPAPNAYQLFAIKGARAAKQGSGSLENVAIYATDPKTLVVELENPVPFFQELVASHFYFPVHASWRHSKETSVGSDPSSWVSNGPFKLESWTRYHELNGIKNANYWDQEKIALDKITIMQLDENTALHMMEKGELDWTGSPMCVIPPDAIPTLKKEGLLQTISAAGTYWFRLNTEKPPFNNKNMRLAFGMALNRQDIVDHVSQGNQKPALGIVPPSFGLKQPEVITDADIQKAGEQFNLALKEMGISKKELPPITLSYSQSERGHKIAQTVQQQWNNAFGIDVQLQGGESKFISEQVKNRSYQMALGSWFADFQDPINFLEVFKNKDNSTNQTGWENSKYVELLDQSAWISDPEKRRETLSGAEKLLLQEMPVIPLFYSTFTYAKSPKVNGIYFSDLGYLDFKNAEIKP